MQAAGSWDSVPLARTSACDASAAPGVRETKVAQLVGVWCRGMSVLFGWFA